MTLWLSRQPAVGCLWREARLRTSARRLVHEARNPLTVMKTHLELLGDRVRNGQPIDKDIRVLREEIDRVADIVGRIGTTDLAADKPQGPKDDLDKLVDDLDNLGL